MLNSKWSVNVQIYWSQAHLPGTLKSSVEAWPPLFSSRGNITYIALKYTFSSDKEIACTFANLHLLHITLVVHYMY